MAALVEVNDIHEHHDGRGRSQMSVHPDEDDEALGRSYVCSMSSAIELDCQDGANCTELALNVQHYLSRIVEELHLISAWSSGLYHQSQHQQQHQQQQHQQQQRPASPSSSGAGKVIDNSAFTAMARLAVVTDIELMRRDVAKAQHELFQRCTTQMAYVQNEANAAISQQNTFYSELRQRLDDNIRASEQLTQSVQALENTRTENDAQTRTIAMTLRQVQQQIAAHPTRIAGLENALATLSAAQFTHEQELQTLQRRVESHETAHNLHAEAARRASDDSLTGLRAVNSQLSAKMQVLRLEMQEHGEAQRRMQQILKAVGSASSTTYGKPLVLLTPGVTPRRPSMATPRAARSGGYISASPHIQSSGAGVNPDSLDGILGPGSATPTVMTTGAGAVAVATTDCFIYAKAALPHRHPASEKSNTAKKPVPPQSTGSCRGAVTFNPASTSSTDDKDFKSQDPMTSLLKVQQSVMSIPLGCEVDRRPTSATQENDTDARDRTASVVPSWHITQRHNSLPDVNICLTPQKLQASRLHTKLQ